MVAAIYTAAYDTEGAQHFLTLVPAKECAVYLDYVMPSFSSKFAKSSSSTAPDVYSFKMKLVIMNAKTQMLLEWLYHDCTFDVSNCSFNWRIGHQLLPAGFAVWRKTAPS